MPFLKIKNNHQMPGTNKTSIPMIGQTQTGVLPTPPIKAGAMVGEAVGSGVDGVDVGATVGSGVSGVDVGATVGSGVSGVDVGATVGSGVDGVDVGEGLASGVGGRGTEPPPAGLATSKLGLLPVISPSTAVI